MSFIYYGVPYKHAGMFIYFGQKCNYCIENILTITLLQINEIQIIFAMYFTQQEL